MSSNDLAISVRGLSKSYQIVHQGERRDAPRAAPIQRIRNLRRRVERETYWALNDVSFDVHKGDVIGIIGRNGAGKSTLLKILSRITEPTSGRIELYGRVGSLLEVGTGFHPELTGRENVYLNGAILGMRKSEIDRQFDAIVDFSGVEKFLDTPVKRYSSGMYVRLAFGVAAHLQPEILIVDEVLAVGDAAFQKKCLGKMESVATEGRTVLFVSHSMAAVVALCKRSLLLVNGSVDGYGPTSEIVRRYQSQYFALQPDGSDLSSVARSGSLKAQFNSVSLKPVTREGRPLPFAYTGCDLIIETQIECQSTCSDTNVAVIISDANNYRVIDVNTALDGKFIQLTSGRRTVATFRVRDVLLRPGTYGVGLWMGKGGVETIDHIETATTFTIVENPAVIKHVEEFPSVYQCRFDSEVAMDDTAVNTERNVVSAF